MNLNEYTNYMNVSKYSTEVNRNFVKPDIFKAIISVNYKNNTLYGYIVERTFSVHIGVCGEQS